MDIAGEVVAETYFQNQEERELENLVNMSEVSLVQPLVHDNCAVPDDHNYAEHDNSFIVLDNVFQNTFHDEHQEMLELKNNPESSDAFTTTTTHSKEITMDSQLNGPIMDNEIIGGNKDMKITKELSLEDKVDPALTQINTPPAVHHQTELINSGKPELIEGVSLFKSINVLQSLD